MFPLNDNRGVALILCLVVIALLTLVVVDFAYQVRVDAALAQNAVDDLQGHYAAKSGMNHGLAVLRNDLLEDLANFPPGQTLDSLEEPWAQAIPILPIGDDGLVYVRIDDEDGKINVNSLVSLETGIPDERQILRMRHLFTDLGLDPLMVGAIVDWIDYDNEPFQGGGGAEQDYYSNLEQPYSCKNAPLDSIAELALVARFSEKLVWGKPVELPEPGEDLEGTGEELGESRLDFMSEFELGESEVEGPLVLGLWTYLTVYGNVKKKVNVNTANPLVIRAMLAPDNIGTADRIIAERSSAPFTREDFAARAMLPNAEAANSMASFGSDRFSVNISSLYKGTRVEARAVVARADFNSAPIFRTLLWQVRR